MTKCDTFQLHFAVVCLDDFLITETGNYSWPTTSAGAAHSQPCGIPRPREDGKDPEVAVRTCDSMGSWLEIDDAMCLTFIGKSFAEISFIVDSVSLKVLNSGIYHQSLENTKYKVCVTINSLFGK